MHKTQVWTISSKQWVVLESRWFPFKKSIQLIFFFFFFSWRPSTLYAWILQMTLPMKEENSLYICTKDGTGFQLQPQCSWRGNQEADTGLYKQWFLLHWALWPFYYSLHFSIQTILALNILTWDLPSTFPKWLFRYVTPITRIRMQ